MPLADARAHGLALVLAQIRRAALPRVNREGRHGLIVASAPVVFAGALCIFLLVVLLFVTVALARAFVKWHSLAAIISTPRAVGVGSALRRSGGPPHVFGAFIRRLLASTSAVGIQIPHTALLRHRAALDLVLHVLAKARRCATAPTNPAAARRVGLAVGLGRVPPALGCAVTTPPVAAPFLKASLDAASWGTVNGQAVPGRAAQKARARWKVRHWLVVWVDARHVDARG